MKISQICYGCLENLVYQAVQLATPDALLRQRAIDEALKVLEDEFAYDKISIVLATKIHEVIREVTLNPDPYRTMKDKELVIARELYNEVVPQHGDNFSDYLKLAVASNAIDFFRDINVVKEDIRNPINLALDDSKEFEVMMKKANTVLYLADNAGEIYFDLPLIKWMRQFVHVSYVVKPSPVQNDTTLEDIRNTGLESEFGSIVDIGVASPGIVFDLASDEFKREFDSADLILAKGMGHYEALSEFPCRGRFFYCLKAKCKPVADSIGVPQNSYVVMLR